MQSEQRSFKFSARPEAGGEPGSLPGARRADPGGLGLQTPPPMGHAGRSPVIRSSWRGAAGGWRGRAGGQRNCIYAEGRLEG